MKRHGPGSGDLGFGHQGRPPIEVAWSAKACMSGPIWRAGVAFEHPMVGRMVSSTTTDPPPRRSRRVERPGQAGASASDSAPVASGASRDAGSKSRNTTIRHGRARRDRARSQRFGADDDAAGPSLPEPPTRSPPPRARQDHWSLRVLVRRRARGSWWCPPHDAQARGGSASTGASAAWSQLLAHRGTPQRSHFVSSPRSSHTPAGAHVRCDPESGGAAFGAEPANLSCR